MCIWGLIVKNKYLFLSGGTSPHTLKWIQEIIKYYDVYLISFNGISEEILHLLGEKKCFQINLQVKPSGGNFNYILHVKEVAKLVRQINPNFINAHYVTSYGFIAGLIKRFFSLHVKLICSAWGSDILVTPYKNFLYKFITKFALKQADIITSDSHFMSDKIKELVGDKKEILTFPFGLDEEGAQKLTKDEKLIYSNRALSKNYNISSIIEWFANLKDEEFKLVIANDGEDKQALLELACRLGIEKRVVFAGLLSKKWQKEYYQKAKFFISIPTSDSTSVSLLEAMNCGCIPIVSNIPANREWVIDGINGVFFTKDLDLNNINVAKDARMLNQKLIKDKAIFAKSIEKFIKSIEAMI